VGDVNFQDDCLCVYIQSIRVKHVGKCNDLKACSYTLKDWFVLRSREIEPLRVITGLSLGC
jgi:hypothetical protein